MLGVQQGLARIIPKRAKRGLFHGKRVLSGNNVSHSMRHTRRKWKPNAQKKTVYSETLDQSFKMQVTAAAMRCIDKAGGLDNYLLTTKKDLIPGVGQQLKRQIILARKAADKPIFPKFYPRLPKSEMPDAKIIG